MSSGFENGSPAAEQLSALADGELDGAAAGAACAAWRDDAELRANLARLAPDRRRAPLRRPGVERRTRRPLPGSPCASGSRPSRWCWRRRAAAARRRPARRRRRSRWLLPSAVAAGFMLVVGTFVVLRPTGAPAPAVPTLARGRAAGSGRSAPVVAGRRLREPAAPVAGRRRQRPDDPRRRGSTATWRRTSSSPAPRRSACRPPSCAAPRSTPSRAETTADAACCRARCAPLALACAAIAGGRRRRWPQPRPGAAVGAAERGAGLAAAHPRCRQPAQLPGHVRGQRRRRRRQRPDRALLRRRRTSTSASSRSTAGSARCSATTTSCTPSGPAARWR